ncbi:hypothetical protein PEBR_36493 [Penicillium brasilianum]|uniref:Uncharacterized protein n=1 Tax=Penicillium brasilianum TaxID=104259 RepID=A0A1S9RCD3_PENBI|nr:hypothetical protein PEBR_36493 [Penicillium brasilianum]
MMPLPPPTRKRSSSVPRGTSYHARTHEATILKTRQDHGDIATENHTKVNKKALIDKLRLELKAHHIDVSGMVLERFSSILPDIDASQEQLKVLHALLVQPMLVTNEELKQLIRLEPPNAVSSFENSGLPRQHAFYIRSWSMTPIQLYEVSKHLEEDGRTFPELDE